MKNTYPNFLQNGKKIPRTDNSFELSVKHVLNIYKTVKKLRDDLQNEYNQSVKNLQRIEYRIFASNCAFYCSKLNTIDFTRFADVDAKQMYVFKEAAMNELAELKKEKKKAEFKHINFVKPQYLALREEDDIWRSIYRWVWDVCSENLEKIAGEHPRDREKRIYNIPVIISKVSDGNKTYYVKIKKFNIEKTF